MKIKTTLNFWDFDGTLIATQTPEHGKDIWSKYHKKVYPHVGWWSKDLSLCIQAFSNNTKPEVHNAYLKTKKEIFCVKNFNYLLTSRMPKLKPHVLAILDKHKIVMDEYFFASDKNKGEKIYDEVQKMLLAYDVTNVTVYEDRLKEVKVIEAFRDKLKDLGVELTIVKIESDADLNDATGK